MARTNHGDSLATPVLQPNSSRFTVTESGFDVGSRTFTVDTDSLARWLPDLDTPDTSIRWNTRSGVRAGQYRTMFVESVSDIIDDKNNISHFTVNYLGLINSTKRDYQTEQTSITNFVVEIDASGKSTYGSAPIVTVIRVRNTRPNPADLGSEIVPPGWVGYNFTLKIGGIVVPTPALARWVLRERDQRKCGNVYETRDMHVFEVIQ